MHFHCRIFVCYQLLAISNNYLFSTKTFYYNITAYMVIQTTKKSSTVMPKKSKKLNTKGIRYKRKASSATKNLFAYQRLPTIDFGLVNATDSSNLANPNVKRITPNPRE